MPDNFGPREQLHRLNIRRTRDLPEDVSYIADVLFNQPEFADTSRERVIELSRLIEQTIAGRSR